MFLPLHVRFCLLLSVFEFTLRKYRFLSPHFRCAPAWMGVAQKSKAGTNLEFCFHQIWQTQWSTVRGSLPKKIKQCFITTAAWSRAHVLSDMSWKQPIKPPTKVPTNVIKSSLCMSRMWGEQDKLAYLLVFLKSRLKTSLKCSESLLFQTKEWMKKKDKTICYIAEKHHPDVNTQVSYLLTCSLSLSCECVFKSYTFTL